MCVCENMQVCVGVMTPRIHPLSMLDWAEESRGGRDAGRQNNDPILLLSVGAGVGGRHLFAIQPTQRPPKPPTHSGDAYLPRDSLTPSVQFRQKLLAVGQGEN